MQNNGIINIPLSNDRQGLFYNLFKKQQQPKCAGKIFEDFSVAIDYQIAYSKIFLEYENGEAGAKWLYENVCQRIRKQAVEVESSRLSEYMWACLNYSTTHDLDVGLVIQPFSSKPGDIQHALLAWKKILSSLITDPLIFDGEELNQIYYILVLITQQEQNHTLDNLLLGVKQGNSEAIRVFRQLISFFGLMNKRVKFVSNTNEKVSWMLDPANQDKVLMYLFGQPDDPLSEEPQLVPVKSEFVFGANRNYDLLAEKKSKPVDAAKNLLAWFGTHEDYFQEITQEFWEEIKNDAKYGLNPKGDIVTIGVKELKGIEYRTIQLVPTTEFLTIKGYVWLTDDYLATRIVKGFTLNVGQPLTPVFKDDHPKSMTALIDKLQQFIVIHAFWKIVTGKVFKVKVKNTKATRSKEAELKRAFLVRPHFRWLPAGQNMTQRAEKRSLETFSYLPPQGKTFVMSDLEQLAEFLNENRKPLFVYSNDDLGYS